MRKEYIILPATFVLTLLLGQAWFLATIEPAPWVLAQYVLANSFVAAALLLLWAVVVNRVGHRPLATVAVSVLWLPVAYVLIQVAAAFTFGLALGSGHGEMGVVRHVHLQFTYDAVYLTLTFIAGSLAGARGERLGTKGRWVCGALAALGAVFVVAARV